MSYEARSASSEEVRINTWRAISAQHRLKLRWPRLRRLNSTNMSPAAEFRRRRKTHEHGREPRPRLANAISVLIELHQRQRGVQLKALCVLLPRRGDGGAKCFFRRRSVGRITFQ